LVFIGIGARKNIFLSFFWWFHWQESFNYN
jgi:hypothetical protein